MMCKKCNAETSVVDSRSIAEGKTIRRRRECSMCEERFTTYEHRGGSDVEQKLQIAQNYINSLVGEIEMIKHKMLRIKTPEPKRKEERWKV